jgi:hypothetical protein
MIPAPGTNWQIMLADLSIVLFLTTFSALAQGKTPDEAPPPPAVAAVQPAVPAAPIVAEPIAIWRAGKDSPPLGEWLKTQAADPRLRVNVHGGYRQGRRDAVLIEAAAVTADPSLAGRSVRLILEPAQTNSVLVTLTFDQG